MIRPLFFIFSLVFANSAWADGLSCALLLEHGESAPYTDMLRAGLEQAAKEFGLSAKVVIAGKNSDQVQAFRKAAQENDLLIVASDNFYEILRDNAANFRSRKFAVIDAGIRASNTSSITFADEQAAFLAGACAALLARERGSQVIGWLSGQDTPAMRSLFSGYAAGAETAVPGMRIIQAIAGSFTDGSRAAEKAGQLADAAVIALAAGAANGAAAQKLSASQALVISVDALQPGLLPQRTAGAITKAVDRAVYELCRDFAAGKFRTKEIGVFDLANGGVDFKGFDEFGAKKYPHIARRIGELKRELLAGNIHLGSRRQRTLCDCLD